MHQEIIKVMLFDKVGNGQTCFTGQRKNVIPIRLDIYLFSFIYAPDSEAEVRVCIIYTDTPCFVFLERPKQSVNLIMPKKY